MGLEETRVALEANRQVQIGRTAENILLSYAEKKPQNFLSVGFAQEIRKSAEALYGEKAEAEAKPEAGAKPEAAGKPEAGEKEEGELNLDST